MNFYLTHNTWIIYFFVNMHSFWDWWLQQTITKEYVTFDKGLQLAGQRLKLKRSINQRLSLYKKPSLTLELTLMFLDPLNGIFIIILIIIIIYGYSSKTSQWVRLLLLLLMWKCLLKQYGVNRKYDSTMFFFLFSFDSEMPLTFLGLSSS